MRSGATQAGLWRGWAGGPATPVHGSSAALLVPAAQSVVSRSSTGPREGNGSAGWVNQAPVAAARREVNLFTPSTLPAPVGGSTASARSQRRSMTGGATAEEVSKTFTTSLTL